MFKKDFDFSTGLHTDGKLNGFKAMIYDEMEEQKQKEQKESQRQLKKFQLPIFNFFDD